jgi:pSer/pThr/pTyr-binding forkhead associated (FHA) protein
VIGAAGALIGRSRECDIVLADANVSRRHAEIRPAAAATWTIADLGSTNGVRVNGRQIQGAEALTAGDRIVLGTAEIVFELE